MVAHFLTASSGEFRTPQWHGRGFEAIFSSAWPDVFKEIRSEGHESCCGATDKKAGKMKKENNQHHLLATLLYPFVNVITHV